MTFDITITCQDTTENIDLIEFSGRNRELTAKAGDGEVAQLRSVSGSVSWVARQARPDQAYHASRLQQYVPKAEVKHLKDANKIVGEIEANPMAGITFKGKAFDWNKAVLVTISVASFANEKVSIVRQDQDAIIEPYHSQMGRLTCLLYTSPSPRDS